MPLLKSRQLVFAVANIVALLGTPALAMASELTYWSMWNEPEPQAQALRGIMDAYTKLHPETTFKVVWNGRQNQTKLIGALQAGNKVDLMDQDGDQLAGGLQKLGQGYQLDAALGSSFKDTLLPGAYDLYSTDGKHYQVPYVYNTVGFWYNKDMMSAAGATEPKTWSDLIKLCHTIAKTGKRALVAEGNQIDLVLLYFSNILERELGPNALLKTFEDKSGQSWLAPEVLDSAKKEMSLWDEGCFSPDDRGFQYPQGQQTVALGESMSELIGSWLPTELSSSVDQGFHWGVFNFPAIEGGKGKQSDLQVALLSMMILKGAPHPDEAISFLKYLTSEDAQNILVHQGNVGVTRKDVAWPDILHEAHETASNASSITNIYGGVGVNYADFYITVLAPDDDKMFLGQISPESFVKTMSEETKKYWSKKQ